MRPGMPVPANDHEEAAIDLSALSDGLVEVEPGLWTAGEAEAVVSYPSDGHSATRELEEFSFWFRHRNSCIAEIVRHLPPGGPIVEIGAGNGFVALGLERSGFRVVALEPGAVGAHHARERGLTPVVRSTLEDARFRPGTLAGCAMFDVLEHVEHDIQFLRRVRQLLRRGGRIYLTVPAQPWLWSADDVTAGHYRRYTKRSLTSALERAGYRMEYLSAFFAALVVPVLLKRALPTRLGLRWGDLRDRHVREHDAGSGGMKPIVDAILGRERRRLIRRPRKLGTSLVAVATVA
jgi:SAM-dependent methyltransferase